MDGIMLFSVDYHYSDNKQAKDTVRSNGCIECFEKSIADQITGHQK